MQIKILGCSGGIGGALRTTSMLLDDDILIDAGSGVGDLSMDELLAIDHVFITHAHFRPYRLFYLCCLILYLAFALKPITVYGSQATLDTLRSHVFNWAIWPDFHTIPHESKPFFTVSRN